MTWLGLHLIDWLVLGVYLLGIVAIGVWTARKVNSQDDYFMGGRRFGKVFMMFFAFGSGTSSEQAVSVAAGSFRNGLAGIWYQFLWLWATPFYWIIAPVFRRMRALTTSDFFEARYDRSTATLYSVLGIAMSITFIAAALFMGAKLVSGLTGGEFPMEWAIAAMTVMFVVYGMAGGLGAAVATDFVQGVLTVLFSFILLPFALSYAAQVAGTPNGFAALHQGVAGVVSGEELLSMTVTPEVAIRNNQEPITPFYILMLSLVGLVGIVAQPHIMGVCGAGKTEWEGRFGFTTGNFLKRLCTIAWTFTGIACVIIYLTPGSGFISPERLAEINSEPGAMKTFADEVFGHAAHDILPTISHGLLGLFFAGLLAAIMSTCDAQMVVGSGLFTENIYKRYINRHGDQRHYVWVGRFAGLGIVALALALMSQFQDAIQILTKYVNILPALIGLSFWFGIVWRGFTPAAVWASTMTAAVIWLLTTTHTPIVFQFRDVEYLTLNIDYIPRMFREWLWATFPLTRYEVAGAVRTALSWQYVMILGSGAIVGIATSLLSRRTSEEKLDHFFRLIHTPVREGEQVSAPCTLPENPEPAETRKLIPLKDIEIPWPSKVGMAGFLIAWVCVGLLVWLTRWLASLT